MYYSNYITGGNDVRYDAVIRIKKLRPFNRNIENDRGIAPWLSQSDLVSGWLFLPQSLT